MQKIIGSQKIFTPRNQKKLSPHKIHYFFTIYFRHHWSKISDSYYNINPSGTKDNKPPDVITKRMKLSTSAIRIVSLMGASGGCCLLLAEADASKIRGKEPKPNNLKGWYREVGKKYHQRRQLCPPPNYSKTQ